MRSEGPRVRLPVRAPRARTFPPAPGGRQPLNFGEFRGGGAGSPALSLGCRYRRSSAAPGAGWAAGEAGPPVALAGCRARVPAPAARLLSRAPGVGSGREAGPRVLAPRAPRRAEQGGGSQSQRRPRAGSAPPLGRVGPQRGLRLCTPRPRVPRPAPAGEPPSPVGSHPGCRGAARRSPRAVARRWHPTPISEPGFRGWGEGPGGRCAPGACWGPRPGLEEEEEDRSEGRGAFPPAPPGLYGGSGCGGAAGTPPGSLGKFEPFS